jgi:hypothetical protein
MTDVTGRFVSQIRVLPQTALGFNSRSVGHFRLTSIDDSSVEVSSAEPDASQAFGSSAFLKQLEQLAWDLVWERQVAVQFEPALGGSRTVIDDLGRQQIETNLEDRVYFNPENPRAGLESYTNFDLLQRIRDHLIQDHLSGGDSSRLAKLNGNGAVLLAVEHFIKGVVNQPYAMAEFYSVVETIENQIGGRNALNKRMGKAVVDKIVHIANNGEHDQRHPPTDPAKMTPLPPNAISEAAGVARAIIVEYAKGIV